MSFGAHSEVGRLRRVMVHRPGLEHTRLTPSNAGELLFDDVLWVARAKAEHEWRRLSGRKGSWPCPRAGPGSQREAGCPQVVPACTWRSAIRAEAGEIVSVSDLAIVAALVFGWGALSARLERFDVTAPITFVVAGLLLTHGPLAVPGRDTQ